MNIFFKKQRISAVFPTLATIYATSTIKAQESEEEINLDIDDVEQEEMKRLLNDPDIDPETFEAINQQSKMRGYQPIPISKMGCMFRTGIEDETWKGFRLSAEWSPTQMFKVDNYIVFDNFRHINNYKFTTTSIVPDKTNPHRGIYLMGNNDSGNTLGLQSHISISDKDKIALIAQFPKPDPNQAMLIAEYDRSWERLETSFKLSNMGSSVSATATIMKNTFLGFEASLNPRTNTFAYSYGIYRKQWPNLTFHLSYISHVPLYSFDILYRYNRLWKMYFNFTKNKSPMIAMTGGKETEVKMTHVLSFNKNTELSFEVDILGNIHAFVEHKIHKNFKLQGNLEISPFARFSKKNTKMIHSVGFGLKYMMNGPEELFEPTEDDFSDLEYDKL